MGRDSELFKAAKSGNNTFIERVFASFLKRNTGHHGFGSIRKSANPNIQDDAGYTLVHHATLHGKSDTVSLLLKCGASVTIPDSSGSCPLHLAAWKGDLEIVQILVTQGPSRANVNQQSDSDDTALHLASQYGYSDVVEFLLQRHADPLLLNIKSETPLDLAAQYGHLDAVHLLISHCPEMMHLSRQEFSPLHLAARNGHAVVALSLINAGISVNTVCERGSPLHEAAMCGKTETVRLLLDKGVNLDLLDSEGHTVLDLLAEYPADKAREIQRMIEEHLESHRGAGVQPVKKHRVVAVAEKTCSPLVRESSALAFKKGDKIDVQRMTSKDIFVGSVHGRTGSFLAQDVIFFKERNGRLVPTDVSRASKRLSGSSTEEEEGKEEAGEERRDREGENKDPLVSKRPPYEHVPAFPTEVVTSPSSTTSEGSLFSPTGDHPQGAYSENDAEKSAKRPNKPSRAKLSKKEKRLQLQKDDGSYSELRPIDPRDAKREFGESLRLNPVGPAFVADQASNPQVTQTHTAHNVDQTVVDNSFMGSYYVLEIGNFDKNRTSQSATDPSAAGESQKRENPEKPEIPDQQGQPGSYYMLEVGNFEERSSSEHTLTASGEEVVEGRTKRSYSSLSQKSYENVTLSANAQKKVDEGHYDTPRSVSPLVGRSSTSQSYENVNIVSDKISVQTSAPVNIPVPKIVGENGAQISTSVGSHSSGTGSLLYENIELSSSGQERRVVLLEGEIGTTHPIGIPRPVRNRSPVASSYSSQSSARSYENVEQAFLNKRGSRNSLNVTPGEKSGPASPSESRENEGRKRGKRREDIYEAVSIGGKGGSRHKRTRSDPNASPTKLVSGHSLFGPERNSSQVGRHSVAVVAADGDSGGVEASGLSRDSCHGNGITEGVGERLNLSQVDGIDSERLKSDAGSEIIENSENPFAGLVISASRQLEDSASGNRGLQLQRITEATPVNGRYETLALVNKSDPAPFTRGRTETIWDNDRVEQEWTQIDTLLSGMQISTSPPTSPSPQPPPLAMQLHPNREVFMWLQGLGLGGYASTLESSGFDRLNFLGGEVLAMDDLEDIGITNRGEQYTIMAAASLLPPPPHVGHASDLSEWLKFLQLEHLEGKLAEFSLQKLIKFWDLELTSVVGIELLGYRKRLQYGIAELRRAHPEWMHERQSVYNSLKRTPPSTSSPIDTVSFIKDYRNIRSSTLPRNSKTEQPVPLVLDQPPKVERASLVSQDSSASSELWQHPVNFSAKYLGSVVVAKVRGTQSTEEACLRLKTSTENMKKIPQIILAISWKGVKFVDAHTMNVVSTHAIRDISHCSQDIEDKKVFAYISKDQGNSYCHVFMAATTEIADDVIATIGQAFEVAYQKVMKARSERASSAEGAERTEKAQSKQ